MKALNDDGVIRARKAAPAAAPAAAPQEHPLMAKLDSPRQDEARRLGLDFDTMDDAAFRAFARGGAAGLAEYQRAMWDEEAAKRG